ncbi:MAG: hypothetical protein NUV80_07500 [Candidatus Berkelbacteria bacterium]|nr:hypothetical protein [Candidatus Berkelbacteria bacterium]
MDLLALFAGDKANQVDYQTYFQAKDMHQKGADPEKIWNETGWFQGLDGKWRFELDDSKSQLRGQASGSLADMYSHGGGLLENYPRLMDTKINYQPRTSGNVNGSFYQDGSQIDLRPKQEEDPLQILTHELQHAINKQQGWSTGMNASQPGYKDNEGEREARAAASRLYLTPDERKKRFPLKDWK